MSNIIGYDNTKEQEHIFSCDFDGNQNLVLYVDKAVGKTVVYMNGVEYCCADAGSGKAPFNCGVLSFPRGDFVIKVESGCKIEKLILTETADIETKDDFEVKYSNRAGQYMFLRPQPEYTPEVLEKLKRHGFLYEEPEDCAYGKMPSGVPLGGMGCGKIDICEDGLFTAFTGNNNQDCPIYRLPGSFFAVSANGKVKMLSKNTLDTPFDAIENVESDLEFPFAELKFSDKELPVSVRLNAFSSHIPQKPEDSALPCVFFDVTLKNETEKETDISLCFSWENIINVGGSMMVTNKGERVFPMCFHTWNGSFVWSDRRKNLSEKRDDKIVFRATDDRNNPNAFGEHALYCDDKDAEVVCDRSILADDEKRFIDYLAGKSEKYETSEMSEFRAGAYIVRKTLKPYEEKKVSFILAWYMPTLLDDEGIDYGVYYTNRFKNVCEVVDYAKKHKERLYKETKEVNDIINASTLPEWFKRRLLDDRFVTNTCSWYDKDGNFSINEAPTGMGGCLGTLDQRCASQGYYTSFFPTLDERELELFRREQTEDGMCMHELGFSAIKQIRKATLWPDLCEVYLVQVYHHFQRTGNLDMLKKHWPHMKKAIEWTIYADDLNCGIPYMSVGRRCTYDCYFWEGINAFIATFQIAALEIGAKAALVLGEEETAKRWTELSEKAKKSRKKYLWNEEMGCFMNAYNPKTEESDARYFISTLAGEWARIRAGIDIEYTEEEIKDICRKIKDNCLLKVGMSDLGGGVYKKDETATEKKVEDASRAFLQYPLAYHVAPSFYVNDEETGWEVAKRTEMLITQPGVSNHFNQPLTVNFDGTRFGLPYYMTAPATWNALEAYSGLVADVFKESLKLSPKGKGKLKIPVFLTNAWFEIQRNDEENEMKLVPLKSFKPCKFKNLTVSGNWNIEGVKKTFENGNSVFEIEFDAGKDGIVLTK